MKPRLTYANVMVTILTFVVLGGGAYAATKLPKNSVGSKQIKKSAVTKAKIANGAVDASKVADGSLTTADLDPSTLSGYAKGSDLNGYLREIPNGSVVPEKIGSLPTAVLTSPIPYNVGTDPGPTEGVDCFGSPAVFPNEKTDDIVFGTISFDNAGIVAQKNPANGACFNGFEVKRSGTYAIGVWVSWEGSDEDGYRRLSLITLDPGEGLIVLARQDQRALANGEFEPTSQAVSAVARLAAGASVVVQGWQSSGIGLGVTAGRFEIAWIGP